MGRPALEVADVFRAHGPAWRETQRGLNASCRSAEMGEATVGAPVSSLTLPE